MIYLKLLRGFGILVFFTKLGIRLVLVGLHKNIQLMLELLKAPLRGGGRGGGGGLKKRMKTNLFQRFFINM